MRGEGMTEISVILVMLRRCACSFTRRKVRQAGQLACSNWRWRATAAQERRDISLSALWIEGRSVETPRRQAYAPQSWPL